MRETRPITSLRIDFETRSAVDLKATGVYPYAADPSTDVLCMAWAFDEEEPELWLPGDPLPSRIVDHILDGGECRAWNAAFERLIWQHILWARYGWPVPALEQWHDTAAEAAAMALPRALGQAAEVLGVEQQKDDKGYRVMLQLSKPRKRLPDGEIIWWDEAGAYRLRDIDGWSATRTARELDKVREQHDTLRRYCKQDVRTECAIVSRVRRLTPREREVYLLDQRVNDRGIAIDRPLIVAAQGIVDEGITRANRVMRELTNGTVTEVTNPGKLTLWLREQGVNTDSVAKAAVREMLSGDLADHVRRALELRADAGRSSVAKLESLLEAAGSDDRLRGLLLYHGASTGRWTGRLVQPQNFPRGEVEDVEWFIDWVMRGEYDAIELVAHPIVVVSSLLRSMLVAGPGAELIAADFSAIEARVLNWLAGQHDILDLFRRGEDVYKHNAVRLYNIPLAEVKKFPHRQTGKFQELGCGFQMGAAKAVSAAKDVYGLTITDAQAKEIVDNYRSTHPEVVGYWYGSERAVIEAVQHPGRPVDIGDGKVKAVCAGAYLYLRLPSGRFLAYAGPQVVEAYPPWSYDDKGALKPEAETKPQVEFSGVNSVTRQWQRQRLYGGLIVENIVQAVSRDLMAEAMLRAEARGYPVVLSVHDEVVAEVPEGFGSVEEFEHIMAELPEWAEGCPVAAEGWRGHRYRK